MEPGSDDRERTQERSSFKNTKDLVSTFGRLVEDVRSVYLEECIDTP